MNLNNKMLSLVNNAEYEVSDSPEENTYIA